MKIIHITDLHFGPYQWNGNNDKLLERINAFNADLVFNTGDMTTDSLEDEFQQAHDFLAKIKCNNIVSILGNHDKFSRRSHDFFRKYIYDGQFVEPKDRSKVKKRRVYMNKDVVTLEGYLYEANFVRLFDIKGKKVMVVALDTCVMHQHTGFMEEEILHTISDIIKRTPHDCILMLTHHPVLSTDNEPLYSSKHITSFINKHKIGAVFCGHTHDVAMIKVNDILHNHTYRQFICGSMSGRTTVHDVNMYCSYENFGEEDEKIIITRMYPEGEDINFVDTAVEKDGSIANISGNVGQGNASDL
ncbi:MAG: metallophosphoesterase [Alphaproteobacteria bacterium]|nr:metallophosphoesterase [Alphaproteobacteria bacterium]